MSTPTDDELSESDYFLVMNLRSYAHYEDQNNCPKTAENLRAAAERLAFLSTRVKKLEDTNVFLRKRHEVAKQRWLTLSKKLTQ